MKVESTLQVVDAKHAYFRWNSLQSEKLSSIVESDIHKYIKLIPLFLQINSKILPGGIDEDVPVGVYLYKPDVNAINDAKSINSKFRYHQEGVIKNYAIEAIYFNHRIIDNTSSCWVIYRSSLNKEQLSSLKEKIKKIASWFLTRGVKIDFVAISVEEFKNGNHQQLIQLNKSLFLDSFYSESVLLAGKYPVWWLIPPCKENEYTAFVEHIKQARFVDEEEFLDLGALADYEQEDLIKYAVDKVQKFKKNPEKCLVELLIIDEVNNSWPAVDGVSYRIKEKIYEEISDILLVDIYASLLSDSLSRYPVKSHVLAPVRLFSRMKNISEKVNHRIIDAFLKDDYIYESSVKGLDSIVLYLNFYKAVSFEIRQIFNNITAKYTDADPIGVKDKALSVLISNMLVFLSDDEGQVPLYNNKNEIDIVLDRIHLKQDVLNETSVWSLVLEITDGNEKTIEGFSSLLGLLAWCWLNRIVNNTTQVSIDSPSLQVKQIEAFSVLETLIQQLKPDLISNIPPIAFENPVKPLLSLLFVNFMVSTKNENNNITEKDDPLSFGNLSENLITHCEQLIVNSWGDVYTREYSGNTGLLKCLCEWTHHAPVDALAIPQMLKVFGNGVGDSTYMAQRVEQVYKEILSFFYHKKHENGRFILRMGSDYHVVTSQDSLLVPEKIGKQKKLMRYLEAASVDFQITDLERLAYTDYPLREIYANNKPDIFQVFFQVINRNYHTWVVDEKGTLWSDVFEINNRESFITHWLFFFRNIRDRLKKINYQEREFPSLEINQISNNQLGGVEFYPVGAESITGNKNFIDIQVSIHGHQDGDQLSLICDGRHFNYSEFKQNAIIECVQYISARLSTGPRIPVYLTDINVPLRIYNVKERNEIQISHILKFKRNFEHRIYKLLDS